MKRFKYILLCIAGLLMTSCDDFLVEKPDTQLESEGIYNSAGSANAALAGMYAKMSDYNYVGFNYFHVVSSTSGVGVSIKSNDVNLTSMNILPSNVNVTNMYMGMYEVINVANDIIAGMENSDIADVKERNRIKGEAYFGRALTYFNLVRLFGKVSLITAPVTTYADAQQPRAEVTEVYSLIVEDLKEAFKLMAEPGEQVPGFPHRYAAESLLAKVYLTLAGNDESSKYWEMAYNAALDVYNNGHYSLVRPYSKLFGSPNKNNSESVFELQYSSSVNSGRMTETTFPSGYPLMSNLTTEGKSWGKTRPSQSMFEMFDADDPRREASFAYEKYSDIFESNAKKKNVMLFPTKKKDGNKAGLAYRQGDSEYAAWKKYYDPQMTASATNANFVFMRYSDVLLILAESANELNKPDAANYLRMVLDRARDANGNGATDEGEIYPLDLSDIELTDKNALRERIMIERLREFTGECDEWYTVRRRGTDYLKKIMENHNAFIDEWYSSQNISTLPKFVYKYDVSEQNVRRNMLLPFPSDEINRNENISQNDQNFGY